MTHWLSILFGTLGVVLPVAVFAGAITATAILITATHFCPTVTP